KACHTRPYVADDQYERSFHPDSSNALPTQAVKGISHRALVQFRRGGNLRGKIGKRGSDCHEPHREGGEEIEVEPQHYEIEGAMDRAVNHPKSHEDQGRATVKRVH